MSLKEIKKIKPASLAKLTAAIYGLVGLFMALIVAILVVGNLVGQNDLQGSVALMTLFNLGAGLLLGVLSALLTALFGWLIGFITAVIYNFLAGKVGGVKIELADAVEIKKDDPVDFNNNQL